MTFKEARERMKVRCFQAALENTPENVKMVRIRASLSGVALLREGILVGPRPATRKSLYIFLHECAHFHLHASGRKARYIEEYEAEMWAHNKMREAGLRVPRSMTKSAKDHIRRKITQAENRGLKTVRSDVKKFSQC